MQHTPALRAELEHALTHALPARLRARLRAASAALAQRERMGDFLARRARVVLAGGLEHARQAIEGGRSQERGAAALAELAVADVGVAVAV